LLDVVHPLGAVLWGFAGGGVDDVPIGLQSEAETLAYDSLGETADHGGTGGGLEQGYP
jgi:hypothetical protein